MCIVGADRSGDELVKVRHTFYPYPSQAKAAATHTLKESARGREVYYTAHLLKEDTERKKENAARVHSLWADLDGAPVPEDPKPTAVLESSPGHWHAYWRFDRAVDKEVAEELNKRLTYQIGADKSKWALATLLRPPQTINHKRAEPFGVTLHRLDPGRAYDPGELDRLLAPLRTPNGHANPSEATDAGDEPPVRLGPSGLRVWRGEQVKHKADGSIDRSDSLFKIGAVLAHARASQRVITDALSERDRALGWNTYLDRPVEYARIAEKVTKNNGYEPPPEPRGHAAADGFRLTDLGNAERLVAHHGHDLRYCHPWGKWLVYDRRRWAVDASGEVERRAVETVRSIYAEASNEPDDAKRKALVDHARRSESRPRVEAMMALARSRPGAPVSPDDLDADPRLLNAQNGTIDLQSGELREHRREDLITKIVTIEYGPDAQAPRFERFLTEIFDGDEDVIGFVRRFAGYSLTGSTEERCFAILHGRGKNGKSTLVELLQDVMGDYATTTDTETVLAKRYQGVGNDVAALKGARFIATAEVEQGRALAESKVKHLTGSDTVTARFLYGEPFSFKPEFKLWLSTNNKPIIKGTDDAIWDRIRLVPFDQRFEGAARDTSLPEKLRAEMPGVLAWMVRGCIEWQRDELGEPEKVVAATEVYRAEMDTLAGFVDECCIVQPDVWCKFGDLYAAYTRWCEESNERPEKKRRFADSLTERGFERDTGAKGVKIRRGIAIRHDGGPGPDGVTDPDRDSGQERPETPDPGEGVGENGNPVTDAGENGNPQNTCKTGVFGERVTEGYPISNNFGLSPLGGESLRNPVTLGNTVTQEGAATPREDARRRLTTDEAERVQRLVHQGMSPRHARAEVLGEEAGL